MGESAKFAPFSTFIEPDFWTEIARRKLHEWKLDEGPFELWPHFDNGCRADLPCRAVFDYESAASGHSARGTGDGSTARLAAALYVYNTVEAFNAVDRVAMAQRAAIDMRDAILNSTGDDSAQHSLRPAIVTVYANLKKHQFHFWMCYPALVLSDLTIRSDGAADLADVLSATQMDTLHSWYTALAAKRELPAFFWISCDRQKGDTLKCHHLSEVTCPEFDLENGYLAFMDPSTLSDNAGWPLRNAIAYLLLHRPGLKGASAVGVRARKRSGSYDLTASRLFRYNFDGALKRDGDDAVEVCGTGWERNKEAKLKAKFVDMKNSMDPVCMAENALDLNLQLMRWRLLPDLQLDKFKATKCLLFGAGTLGCAVARLLLAWGVRHITFVDSARVSLSNPARQSLFTHADAVDSAPKAEAAARRLAHVHPGVTSGGHALHVPMPGHTVGPPEHGLLRDTTAQLDALVQQHDVVFMLMDSREARWLPTMLAAFHNKVALTAALGFDSFAVLRHGSNSAQGDGDNDTDGAPTPGTSQQCGSVPGRRLACYFCSDITAPANSTRDRTLDQQCTVVRPGLCNLASGVLVELFAALMQHPAAADAPANLRSDNEGDSCEQSCLGSVPHQIRGYVSKFTQMTLTVARFDNCVACSDVVRQSYGEQKGDFVLHVCNDPTVLERLTKLDQVHQSADNIDLWEYGDSDSIGSSVNA